MSVSIEQAVLHIVRTKSRATPESLAEALAVPDAEISSALNTLTGKGFVRDTGKPRLGWMITPEGRRAADERMTLQSPTANEIVAGYHERFRMLDDRFERLRTEWQNRDVDESDPADFAARLAPIDDGVRTVLRQITPLAHHFGGYEPRFRRARWRFENGSDQHFSGVHVDSYDNIWSECRECFLITLGRAHRAPAGK